ncbi:MAG: 2-C-methyl-D-erythritol 4-phosphate cytidylyltransferase (EC / 2-C-methyl-D-erythritol 2,4-cyclodiphosphate synthase (EC [uncultured Sulfurovum sp.]|uniref:Bifunctional enzyme IspD/IspF n=1 Tax=uncultured Sulfurovum sp. TaxID=269237 RepID=A0A6S6SHU8_9BACT|nr:MAG: 2-C-methyl-D-erythritol 4-phosphate cytidylyltransferase (EC / 2-C-methyl-D-erythritol 2,4-cyclodiphosphate synthase (EC [uncultured Sulfurovum sp.]
MFNTTLILLGAGSSTRFDTNVKKQWIFTKDTPLWQYVAEHFEKSAHFDKIIIVSSSEEISYMRHFASYTYIEGGNSRQKSLQNALAHVSSDYVMVSDIARCCIPSTMIQRILEAKEEASCIVPVLAVTDTLYLDTQPINREKAKIIQTPQLSRTTLLKKALHTETLFTDDSSAITSLGETVHFVEGSSKAHKLTTLQDLQKVTCLSAPSNKTLTGFGIDIHPFEKDKQMFLCGVPIDVNYGFKAHSDGDVAIHALIDALLGAAGMGDIGELYPDTEDTYAGADSKMLLSDTVKRIESFGYSIGNVDLTIIAEAPKINPYKIKMKETIATLLGIRKNFINIKATTAEKLGFIGRKEGVTVHAVANITYTNWKTL